MMLFLLRGTFWLAVVAIALPWFVRGSAQLEASVASAAAPRLQTAARVPPPSRYFDDVTGSVAQSSADCARDCGGEPAKVDLIAVQLSAPPQAARVRSTAEASASKPASRRVASRRPASISDLLAR